MMTTNPLSEPSTVYLAAACLLFLLFRRRPFARSARHPAVSAMIQQAIALKENLMHPFRRLSRRFKSKAPTQPWIWIGFESLEGRQFMSGSAPTPPSTPPPTNEPEIEHSKDASATNPTSQNRSQCRESREHS